MDKKKEQEEIQYPERYEYMRDVVRPYRDDIWKCNQQIEKISQQSQPVPEKPGLHYNPYGSGAGRYRPSITTSYWEKQKEEHQKELDHVLDVHTKDLDPQDQISVREAVRNDVDRNPFHGQSKEELLKQREEVKDLSRSQNYSARLLELSKEKVAEKQTTADIATAREERAVPDYVGRLLLKNRDNAQDITRNEPAKKKEKDLDRD